MKAIILTGSNGYIGKKVLTFFEKKKIRIFCLQRKIPKKKNKNCVYFTYKNIEKIKKNNIELLIHLAAADPENTRENNIIKQNSDIDKIIVKLKKNNNIKKIFFSSSNSIFSDNKENKIFQSTLPTPINSYGLSKIRSEKMIKKNFQDYLILRLPSVIDKDFKKGLIFRIKEKMKKNKNIYIYNLSKKYNNLFHVNNLIRIIYFFYKKSNQTKKIYNICSTDQMTMIDLIKLISKKLKKKYKIVDCGNNMKFKLYFSNYPVYFKNINFWKIKKIINNSFK